MTRGLCRVVPTLALLATVMSLSAPDTSPAAQAPKGFFGVHPRFIDGDIDYAEMKAADVGLLRTGFNIAGVKSHANDAYDWGHFDSIVTGTASNGIDLLPVLLGVPRYISTKPDAVPLGNSETEWRAFLAALVERYGPDGEFWSLNPAIPYRPIGEWQIWNEENALSNWKGKPKPREYGRLLAISADAIHSQDPDALTRHRRRHLDPEQPEGDQRRHLPEADAQVEGRQAGRRHHRDPPLQRRRQGHQEAVQADPHGCSTRRGCTGLRSGSPRSAGARGAATGIH